MASEPINSPSEAKRRVQRAFGVKLQRLRKGRGMTQEQLAEKTERSVDMISGMERGAIFPSLETLVRIANATGCTVEELFNLDYNAKLKRRSDVDEIVSLLEDQSPVVQKAALSHVKTLLDVVGKLKPTKKSG